MRKILFRGQTEYNKVWVTGNLVIKGDTYYIYSEENVYPNIKLEKVNGFYIYIVIKETIGQYTGLKDKNGKKIFEGDLVKHEWDDKPYIVHFKEDRGGYSPFANDGGCGCCCDCDFTGVEGIEIVGNIYDEEVK